jgi:hypothetical protein
MSKFHRGQRLLATRNHRISVLIQQRAPFTSNATVDVPKGTMLVINDEPMPAAAAFFAVPVDYARFEREQLPESEWRASKYDGYGMVIDDDDVGDWLELVQD